MQVSIYLFFKKPSDRGRSTARARARREACFEIFIGQSE